MPPDGDAAPPPRWGTRREIFSWCLYDFANSAFTTLVVTFIYATYFTRAMVGEEVRGDSLWFFVNALGAATVALLAPVLGALTNATGRRKPVLLWVTLQCIAATAVLAFIPPPHWRIALLVFFVANVGYETGQVLYNAFLPELAPPGRIGRVSGYGWALGYVGGLSCLVIAFTMTGLPDGQGGWRIEPWLPTAEGWNVRATNLLTALWFLAFMPPLFLAVRSRQAPSGLPAGRAVAQSFRELAATWRQVRRFRQAVRFLLARLFYNDGLVAVIAFGGIYAATTFDMSFGEVVLLGIWLNVPAMLGAAALGHLDDRVGAKRTLLLTLVVLIGASIVGATAASKTVFWAAATGIGLMMGPNQAASRSLMGRFTPARRQGEFYGFYAFSGRATSFLGHLTLGAVIGFTGSQRLGMAALVGFFALGLALLLGVDEGAGIRAAREDVD